ncbi:ATPase protein [Stachybotrys elegans]|uniref:ATPase protein n=1 Tax=Stachybotrys elegans TaxID=80388 RepID=A0A8K0SJ59_9HYPO|nr:ATPase protein [Stachybotrys elegans]
MPSIIDNERVARLQKLFGAVTAGKRTVSSTHDAGLFLEAAQAQESGEKCLELIMTRPSGLDAIRRSVRVSSRTDFLCKHIFPFLGFLASSDAKALRDGAWLQQLVVAVVDPPTAWEPILKLYRNNEFLDGDEDTATFAWLCQQVVLHQGPELDVLAQDLNNVLNERPLTEHSCRKVRETGYCVQKALQLKFLSGAATLDMEGPGGRHDNDFADFRKVSIYPTSDEFSSTVRPYYRRAAEISALDPSARAANHIDNMYRLLREDMLADMREDILVARGQKKGKKRSHILRGLFPVSMDTGDERRGKVATVLFGVRQGLEKIHGLEVEARKNFLKDNPRYLKNKSFGAFLSGNDIIGFAFVVRGDYRNGSLLQQPPLVGLQFTSSNAMIQALVAVSKQSQAWFLPVDTPVFAYEPVLERLKATLQLPLEAQLLRLEDEGAISGNFEPNALLKRLSRNLMEITDDPPCKFRVDGKDFPLDKAQAEALAHALTHALSVIQGPPGTGKSYVGALIAKMLLQNPSTRILVLSYTNHALDEFLKDLQKIGIPEDSMTRIGSKCDPQLEALAFERQFKASNTGRTPGTYAMLNKLRDETRELRHEIDETFNRFKTPLTPRDILDYLEFSQEERAQEFWEAFQVPQANDGFTVVDRRGAPISADYLIQQWQEGRGPGFLAHQVIPGNEFVWNLRREERKACIDKWIMSLRGETLATLQERTERFNEAQCAIDDEFNEAKRTFIKKKRVIGCTTTGAAMYTSLLASAAPDVVIVEEAGEIKEADTIAALASSTEQLILIGDHKQLRPKYNNYSLSVEKGDGYDVNRSLFERMILQHYSYQTLVRQHRMHPEISQLVRSLTYPTLLDGKKTSDRPEIRGIRARVAFINHDKPEEAVKAIGDRRDPGEPSSKENVFEANMVIKVVKYLAQQGYGTNNMVVLTPYLGQLRLLREKLSKDNDPLLSDLDSSELVRAGLMTEAAAKVKKQSIRLSTIDNYQGEESDIVIASLTRSNSNGDIGFMKAPERLNVLISRARNCLIMIGNMETFLASPQGQKCWEPFFALMKEHNFMQDGLIVRCEQHPESASMLQEPKDFDVKCPDGGCDKPCDAMLGCGRHRCPRRCHRLEDHSKTPCNQMVNMTCEKQHEYKVRCADKDIRCRQCLKEEEDMRRRLQRDLEMEKARAARESAYRQELEQIQDELAHHKRLMQIKQDEEAEQQDLVQKRAELESLKERRAQQEAMDKAKEEAKKKQKAASSTSNPSRTSWDVEPGSVEEEWEEMKKEDLAQSPVLDELMSMIGLEEVKRTFLSIKSRVDTALRQDIPITKERYGCTLLGNPGTGKTTVARLYARFLSSMGVVSGSAFEETSGSKLANIGVKGCQTLIDDVLEKGGGIIFIDEAYQLSSGNNPGGAAVLDFLLAEAENLTGKICFVLAGYAKQMESFFAHNPGFPSRFPLEMKFSDYSDKELLRIFERQINRKFKGTMRAEDGLQGLYCRIATRRVGRGRGKEGFGNARAVENLVDKICRRQSDRLTRDRRRKRKPDDFLLTKEDLIGPEPANTLSKSETWTKLQQLVGLGSVKEDVKSLFDSIQENYHRELNEESIIEYNLNRVFLGNPGTGKTTVAKMYGQILVDLGLLSNGEVIVKNPSDFVGSVLGQSEQQTKGILAATEGKVLVIDEAYGLYGGGGGSDIYKTAVIDTIVATVHSTPGDDRCVLLLGYRDQMEEMFQNVNPGLSRRFPISSAFNFEDFTRGELEKILDLKLGQQGFGVTQGAREVVLDMLDRARNRPHFGNAGEVDILLNEAKSRHQKRLSSGETKRRQTLEAKDFDPDHDRLERSETNVTQLFTGVVGCEGIVAKLQGYQRTVKTMKGLGMDPKDNIPFNFLFRGPPGTGKTTTARKMAKVFYDMGFLSTATVEDCSASDLVGQYVGQTGPKVRQLLDKALGRVLLIDEAYRLAEGHFAKEALDEIVDAVTKEKYRKRLIIILAGYEDDINRLLNVNPGLTSRFPEVIDFCGLEPDKCFELMRSRLSREKKGIESKGKAKMDISCLQTQSGGFFNTACQLFKDLSAQPSWASARDVETLTQAIFKAAMDAFTGGSNATITVSEEMVLAELGGMLSERTKRGMQAQRHPLDGLASQQQPPMADQQQRDIMTNTATTISTQAEPTVEQTTEQSSEDDEPAKKAEPTKIQKRAIRDAGVSDEIWEQLQRDAEAEEERERAYQAKVKARDEAANEEMRSRILGELIEEEEKEERERAEEEERERAYQAELKARNEEMRRRLLEELAEEEKRREKEAKLKRQLEMSGRCPAGFSWIRQAGGFRCAGGSHFVTEGELTAGSMPGGWF